MQEHSVFEAHTSYVLDLLFSRDSQTLVSAGMDNLVKPWTGRYLVVSSSDPLRGTKTA